eukprot:CAMPEP_0174758892 /NCGR_PEP_ID=MMETSP1094-20130205/107996_1 /TAXON_ID=156173 /ORGANISM="Chrysochromulina brevifilum, Strain UTEX LB 985" /LENGTH=155 /DNA_ID=CAMNT_0015964823 /DNA_START=900 /DNA_END=1363 /DNA_ORIENTATION=-
MPRLCKWLMPHATSVAARSTKPGGVGRPIASARSPPSQYSSTSPYEGGVITAPMQWTIFTWRSLASARDSRRHWSRPSPPQAILTATTLPWYLQRYVTPFDPAPMRHWKVRASRLMRQVAGMAAHRPSIEYSEHSELILPVVTRPPSTAGGCRPL